jgi:hypothetical protein
MNSSLIVGCLAALMSAAAACSTPVPAINLQLNTTNDQECPSSDCGDVLVPCPMAMSIKIFDPNNPNKVFLNQCTPVNHDSTNDLCALNGVNLASTPIPVQHVEVQVVVFAQAGLALNADGSLICPDVPFAATGFPVEQSSLMPGPGDVPPVVGGVGFYDPGDSKVDVNLGCTNLAALQSCVSKDQIAVDARITNFSTGTFVLQGTHDDDMLVVSIGEPQSENGQFTFNVGDLTQINVKPGQDGAPEHWGGTVDVPLQQFACLNVLQLAAEATATVTCAPKVAGVESIGLGGVWITPKQLSPILSALGSQAFPDTGLTIGMVVDDNGAPVTGQTVTAGKSTIQYLSPDGHGGFTVAARPSATSTIFVSTDAPFPTEFVVNQGAGQASLIGFGGGIAGRVTAVLLSAP